MNAKGEVIIDRLLLYTDVSGYSPTLQRLLYMNILQHYITFTRHFRIGNDTGRIYIIYVQVYDTGFRGISRYNNITSPSLRGF